MWCVWWEGSQAYERRQRSAHRRVDTFLRPSLLQSLDTPLRTPPPTSNVFWKPSVVAVELSSQKGPRHVVGV